MYDRRKYFYRGGLLAGGAGIYYWSHLERAPITDRSRFMNISPHQETWMAKLSYDQIMAQYQAAILPPNHPICKYVNRVAQRIIGVIDPSLVQPGTQWKVYVIDEPIANAFVLPGGEIFIFTGILPIAANEDGLAAVIGHEVQPLILVTFFIF